MSKLREIGPGLPLPGSPVAALMAATVVAAAAGEVPCACPHPGTPSRLRIGHALTPGARRGRHDARAASGRLDA